MKLRADRAEDRKREAIERQTLSDALSPERRLAKLDDKLGVNSGASKERARLAKLLIKPKKVKKVKDVQD